VLNCNLVWIFYIRNHRLKIWATDTAFLSHYWQHKYYVHDPNINLADRRIKTRWHMALGIENAAFQQSGFFYDALKMFHIEEFVSIDRKIQDTYVCFRFFTAHNRFIFANDLLNTRPMIQHFMNALLKKMAYTWDAQIGIPLENLLPLS
jgi:hypothetical protein